MSNFHPLDVEGRDSDTQRQVIEILHLNRRYELYDVEYKTCPQSASFENKPPNLSNLNNFHLIEVVDRVSETQLQASEIQSE